MLAPVLPSDGLSKSIELSNLVVWVNVSPSLKSLDSPLLKLLSEAFPVARWEYLQTWDEGSSLESAVELLASFLQQQSEPVHLGGHGISGVVAMMTADRYPHLVKTLILLGTSPQPGMTWHAYYYHQRSTFPLAQNRILTQLAQSLFGPSIGCSVKTCVHLLGQDLTASPSPHSIFHIAKMDPVEITVPLLVCAGGRDVIMTPPDHDKWKKRFKSGDRLCVVPNGYHFFHAAYPDRIASEILDFLSVLAMFSPA